MINEFGLLGKLQSYFLLSALADFKMLQVSAQRYYLHIFGLLMLCDVIDDTVLRVTCIG
jgi:hypothetical protein